MSMVQTSASSTLVGVDPERVHQASALLRRAGAVGVGFAGIQYDLNSTWRRLPTGREVNANLCDHNCTTHVDGVATGGNYVCPASLSLNRGVSRKWLTPADVILGSIATLTKGIERTRARFFGGRFEAYCDSFDIPNAVACAIKEELDRPVLEINLFGGNPEMHPEVAFVIRELRAAGHAVHFTTTGRRLMRERQFVEELLAAPPTVIALSADDFDDAAHIQRLADLTPEQLLSEWKSVKWQHGQRQKAYEATYVAKLADELPGFPPLLFNMVLHPGNLTNAHAITSALAERFPGVLINPFPAQSAFLSDQGEPALRSEHAAELRDLVDQMLDAQAAAAAGAGGPVPYVPRLHYWLMLRAVFDWAGDRLDQAMSTIVGDGIWRCYQDTAAGRYLQVGMGTPDQTRTSDGHHPGGHLGCFWNNETVTKGDRQVWGMGAGEVVSYLETGKQALAAEAARPCSGCAFPRLTYDMLATETGMRPDLLPFYLKRRAQAMGF